MNAVRAVNEVLTVLESNEDIEGSKWQQFTREVTAVIQVMMVHESNEGSKWVMTVHESCEGNGDGAWEQWRHEGSKWSDDNFIAAGAYDRSENGDDSEDSDDNDGSN